MAVPLLLCRLPSSFVPVIRSGPAGRYAGGIMTIKPDPAPLPR
jgi:hypothetical protein